MHVHRWSAQNQRGQGPSAAPSSLSLLGSSWLAVTGWVLVRSAMSSRSQQFLRHHLSTSKFCLIGAPWILGGFAHYFHILDVFWAAASPTVGTRGRRKVCTGWCDPLAVLPLSERGSSSSKSSLLGLSGMLAFGGCVNCTLPSFIAINDVLACQLAFALLFLLVLSHTPPLIHSSYQPVFLLQLVHLHSAQKCHELWMLSLVTWQLADNASRKAPFQFITQS